MFVVEAVCVLDLLKDEISLCNEDVLVSAFYSVMVYGFPMKHLQIHLTAILATHVQFFTPSPDSLGIFLGSR